MTRIDWLKSFNKIHLSLVFLALSLNCFAQNLNDLQNKYPDQNEIILEESDHYFITLNKKNEIVVTSNSVEDYLILKNFTSGVGANESIYFSELVSITNYEAYTIGNEAEKFKKTPVKLIKDKPLNSNNVFNSDTKLKILTYSNLNSGARKVLKYNIAFKDPMLLHRFNFASHIPSENRKISITVDNNIELGYKIFNDPDQIVQKTIDKTKKTTTYNFIVANAPAYKLEDYSLGRAYELPHLHFWINNYTINNQKHNVFNDVNGLYKYYSNFIKNVNQTEDENLKQFTLSLVKDAKTDDEKMQLIFKYAQEQIKYVAFESGYEGFIPRNASLVYERKFGDCKDMASIITEMAKYAGVENVNLTWIGTRELPYSYHELPTPAVDNHMIASYEKNGKIIFLDATDAQIPFGYPSEFIQGKEALIAQGDRFKIIEVPTISAEDNKYKDVYTFELKGNKIIGKGKFQAFGLTRSYFLNRMGDDTKYRNKNILNVLERGNDKLNISNFNELNITDKNLPYEVDYEFDIENYVIKAADESYLNMFLYKPLIDMNLDVNRKTIADLNRLQKFEFETTFIIPENSTVSYIPENSSYEDDFLKYKINFSKHKDRIVLNYIIENKKTSIQPGEVKAWNESLKKLKNQLSETIVIKNL